MVFLSATYVTPEDKEFALSLGAARFIEKPIDAEDFLLTVAELVIQHQSTQLQPLDMEKFYSGYRTRLENKLRQRIPKLRGRNGYCLPCRPTRNQRLNPFCNNRSVNGEIQEELYSIFKTIEELKK